MDNVALNCCTRLGVHSKEIVVCILHILEGKKHSKKYFKKLVK